MLPYQEMILGDFVHALARGARRVLEVGSDLELEVASALAFRRAVEVVATNLDPGFPRRGSGSPGQGSPWPIRTDGRCLPFADASFDAVLSLATLEHVIGVEGFLAEVARVLRPDGLFYLQFGPIWSSAIGHHVFAIVGTKEARFWKPGRNPIPSYAHLLMTAEELERELRAGPCTEELIPAILEWVYRSEALNRLHLEEYLEALRSCPLALERIVRSGAFSGDEASRLQLEALYGPSRDFGTTLVTVILRTPPPGRLARVRFYARLGWRQAASWLVAKTKSQVAQRLPEVRWLVRRLRQARA
jgi:SAM-dependent methyltransferase